MISWGSVYHCSQTVNVYRTAPKHVITQTEQAVEAHNVNSAEQDTSLG